MHNEKSITDSASYKKIPDFLNTSPIEAVRAEFTELAPGTVTNIDEMIEWFRFREMQGDSIARKELTTFSKRILIYSIGFTSVLTVANMTLTALRIPCLDSAQFIAANVTSISYNLLLVAFKYYFKDKKS